MQRKNYFSRAGTHEKNDKSVPLDHAREFRALKIAVNIDDTVTEHKVICRTRT
jgi:hypothetical protein